VSEEQIDAAVRAIIHAVRIGAERELPSRRVGEFVMDELRKLDQVAYVRFASVYRSFEDVQAFREEIERLERDLPGLDGLQLPLLDEAAVPTGRKR
jgi:transcriptional repressor NrdR